MTVIVLSVFSTIFCLYWVIVDQSLSSGAAFLASLVVMASAIIYRGKKSNVARKVQSQNVSGGVGVQAGKDAHVDVNTTGGE